MNFLDYVESPMLISTGPTVLPALNSAGPITGSATRSAIANGSAIQSKYRGPMLINEISFVVEATGLDPEGLIDPRVSIRTSIQAGTMSLTDDYIPMALLGVSNGLALPNSALYGVEDIAPDGPNYGTAGHPNWANTYWRFPKPLFYPPGIGFTIRYQRNMTDPWGALIPFTIDCVVRGYYLKKDMPYPVEIDVPYATGGSFAIPGDNTTLTPAGTQRARTPQETTYKNPFRVPLWIQRFTARYYQQRDWNGSGSPLQRRVWDFSDGANPMAYAATVKMQKQSGEILIPNAVPLWDAFDFRRQAWNVSSVLEPNEKIDVRMNTFYGRLSQADATGGQTFHGWPQIGMIGHRKEVLT